jgi:hypothetical protein
MVASPAGHLHGRAFYNVDRGLRFLSANDAALAHWGKTSHDIVGRPLAEVFPQAPPSAAYAAHLQALRSFQRYRGVLRSPILGRDIDLEIHPSADGLRVSFAPAGARPQRSAWPGAGTPM